MPESYNWRRQTKLRTPFIHVPAVDWSKVRAGIKREYRVPTGSGNLPATQNMPYFPIMVVAWAHTRIGIRHEELMILEEAYLEPLRAISPESLKAEGFATRREFKHYWNLRHAKMGWRGMSQVVVIRIRPLDEGDLEEQKAALVRHLYGLWLDE